VPHHADAVIVSMDFESQELVIIADYSRDENMLACFIGDNKRKMHTLTALGIAARLNPAVEWAYAMFEDLRTSAEKKGDPLVPVVKKSYDYGKKVNFTTEYCAMADKVAQTLLISKEDAQAFIDAKEAAFPGARAWKDAVIEELKNLGYVTTKGGARRHLRDALNSDDAFERSKAERQGVNFKVQGTAAEQTKQSEGEAWRRKLVFKYDCVYIGPVHDELVWSCAIKDLYAFIPEAHACMVRAYGGMVVPITSSISFGPDYHNQIEIGNQPTREAIDRGLAEMTKVLQKEAA
jgi:DNA polymerase-1